MREEGVRREKGSERKRDGRREEKLSQMFIYQKTTLHWLTRSCDKGIAHTKGIAS